MEFQKEANTKIQEKPQSALGTQKPAASKEKQPPMQSQSHY